MVDVIAGAAILASANLLIISLGRIIRLTDKEIVIGMIVVGVVEATTLSIVHLALRGVL